MRKNEIQKRERDGISIRAIAAEAGVHKRTVLPLTKQTYAYITFIKKAMTKQTYAYITFIKKAMFTQLKCLIFGSVVLSSVYEFFGQR
jgi:hypothetical protein